MILKRWCYMMLILTATLSSAAQEEFVDGLSQPVTSFPFKMLTGGIVILQARLGDLPDTLQFVLDTGSGGISLDSLTAALLGLKTEESQRTLRGIAGIRKVRFAYGQTLRLPGLDVENLDFHISDYTVLSSVYGVTIDGIIGHSFLSRYIVKINYDSMKVFVQTKGSIRYPKGGYLLKPQGGNIPVTAATIIDDEEVSSRFYFDTGAGMCVLMTTDFVEDSAFLSGKKRWYASQAEGIGGKTPMKQGVVRQVRLGPFRFRNVPAYIFEDKYNITSYPQLGGLIGNDLLRRFNLIINYDKKDIHLLPNSHYKEPFDYSYTGLGMYDVDGAVRVLDVMKDSPAEAAGFKVNDIIMAVKNYFGQPIQVYKNLMQHPGERVKILVYRDGEPLELTLRVRNLMK